MGIVLDFEMILTCYIFPLLVLLKSVRKLEQNISTIVPELTLLLYGFYVRRILVTLFH